MDQYKAVQYLVERVNLSGGQGTTEDRILYMIIKAYQDITDGHYYRALQRFSQITKTIKEKEK